MRASAAEVESQQGIADITRSQGPLRKRDFAAFFENSPHDLFVLNVRPDGTFVFEHINPTLTRSTGYTCEMLIGKQPDKVLTPANAAMLLARYRECVETREQVEYDVTAITPAGELIRHTILVPIVDRTGSVTKILGTSVDVTALRRAEAQLAFRTQELHELNERLRRERRLSELIVESTADGIIVVDTELRYVVWNPAMERINGKLAQEVLGKTVFEDMPRFIDHPVGHAWQKAVSGERAEIRDFRFFSKSRGAEITYDADFAPLRGQEGFVIGAVCVLRETTDRRRVEEVLHRSQKLEAVAQLTGGVAHDFNNLLTSVVGCLELIEREQHPARVRQLMETALRSADRGAQLVQQLLAFAGRQTLRAVSLDLNNLLKELEVLLRHAAGEGIQVTIDGQPDLWHCEIDRAQFEAAVMNLVINARDAMPSGGQITLRTFNIAAENISPEANVRPGEYVALAVKDNGEGMSRDIAEKAMEPFFTTKEIGKGTGLGLSMVHGFLGQLGGGLLLESEPGLGTRVTLYFPRDRLDTVNARSTAASDELTSSGASVILVVEDNEQVRELSADMLINLGYRALTASDSQEALQVLRDHNDVDLLFTDLIMPGGLSGSELVREARRLCPKLAVLLTTGYARALTIAADEFPFIGKPFRLAELSQMVAKAIQQASH
jgi:PAS domain S-box-containing protein